MCRPLRTFALAFIASAVLSGAAAAQSNGRLHGSVSDESGAMLPGVTVTVAAQDGRPLAVVTTDAVGTYATAVPPGLVRVTLSLEGFSSTVVEAQVNANADTAVATARMVLASRAETVVVEGKVTAPPPPATVATRAVAPHDRDSICGPAKPDAEPESLGVIQAHRYKIGELFAADDQVVIDGGTASGLSVGQNVVARRTYRISGDADRAIGEHTSGVLQIVDAGDRSAIAVVLYACDEIMRGDRLASFAPEPLRDPEPFGVPAYDAAARVLFADSGQLVGVPRRFLVIDRGRDDNLRTGQRLTLFRRARHSDRAPIIIGDAVIVAIRHDSATIRIERATDAIQTGDWAAPQRPADTHEP